VKSVDSDLSAALASGVTTLATLWRVRLGDGRVLGFTDHDRPLTVDGVTHEAASGLSASEAVARADLSIGGLELDGALDSETIRVEDLVAGLWDGATIEIDLVDWTDPARRLRLRTGVVGEITRLDGAFRAELRSLSHRLDETRGRLFHHRCDADLGDARCGVALVGHTATIVAVADPRRLVVTGLAGFAEGFFDRGLLTFLDGAEVGTAAEIRVHRADPDGTGLELWQATTRGPLPGDRVRVGEGCDKRFETCRDRFANARAFRGFPHMPGNDFLVASPSAGMVADGGALVP
jgi:uncharacterized phage protein (TIGR02218 family)